jgi:hypothetical protein
MPFVTETDDASRLFTVEFSAELPEGKIVEFDVDNCDITQLFVPETMAQIVKHAIAAAELKVSETWHLIFREDIRAYCVVSRTQEETVVFRRELLKKVWMRYAQHIPDHLIAVLEQKEECHDEFAPLLSIIRSGDSGGKSVAKIVDVLQNMFVMDSSNVLLACRMRKQSN